jgi:Ca2+-binding RTX toxin-like protein
MSGLLQVDGKIANATTTVETGGTLGGNGRVGATQVDSGGALAPGASAGILRTGDLDFGAAARLEIEIGGTQAGVGGYDRVKVKGTVDVSDAILDLSLIGGFVPSPGKSFKILANDGDDAIVGTFAGLAEGATFKVDGTTFRITYQGGDGNDVVLTDAGVTIVGTSGADVVNKTTTVPGQPLPTQFADLIKGKAGADNLSGLKGDDTILGNNGADILKGNKGDDTLDGGNGNDTLEGGPGDDVFVFSAPPGRKHADTIADFEDGDMIHLDSSVYSGLDGPGPLKAAHFSKGGPKGDEAQVVYYRKEGVLYYDGNGEAPGGAGIFATVTPGTDLSRGDFLLV